MTFGTARGRGRRLARTSLLLAFAAMVIMAGATIVTITTANEASYGGSLIRPYYENLNAPITGCTTPCLTVDTQNTQPATSGSFALPAGASMYLWSPQFPSSTSIPAGSLSMQIFADPPAPAIDVNAWGTSSKNQIKVTAFITTQTNEIVVISVVTYSSGSSITVTGVSDSKTAITWQSSARRSLVSCSGTQEVTMIEWYGTASSIVSSDTVTVSLSSTPTASSAIVFGVSGADMTSPFDPAAGLPNSGLSSCTGTAATPSVSGVSTADDNDFVFTLFGGYTSTTETSGNIGGVAATLARAVSGTGSSNGIQYVSTSAIQSSASCSFGTQTTYWAVLCDALVPLRQTITVSYVTTDSAGTVQSTMISGSSATLLPGYPSISMTSTAGTVPASGYIRVVITAPSTASLTVFWGQGKPTNFQVSYTYRST